MASCVCGGESMSLRKWAARFSCLILILSSLMCVGVCFADMPNPGPQKHDVEIQGRRLSAREVTCGFT